MYVFLVIYRCESGRVLNKDSTSCIDQNECLWQPCLHGATCINIDPGKSVYMELLALI